MADNARHNAERDQNSEPPLFFKSFSLNSYVSWSRVHDKRGLFVLDSIAYFSFAVAVVL